MVAARGAVEADVEEDAEAALGAVQGAVQEAQFVPRSRTRLTSDRVRPPSGRLAGSLLHAARVPGPLVR